MDTERLRNALEQLGLTAYQADAYLTLLEVGMRSAREIANRCSVPSSRIYDVFRDLEQRGFVEVIERDKLYVKALEPIEVTSQLRHGGTLLTNAADEIEDQWEEPQAEKYRMSVVKHRETVIDRVRSAIPETETTIELAVTVSQLESLLSALREAYESGCIVRVSLYNDPTTDDLTGRFQPAGAITELRRCGIPGPFLAIIDRRETYFSPNIHSNETYGIVVHDEIMSFIYHWYYLSCLWTFNETIHRNTDGSLIYMTIEEFIRDFVPLWNDGIDIEIEVNGYDRSRNRMRIVRGPIRDIFYLHEDIQTRRPTLEQLAGLSMIAIEYDGEEYLIGGWGALFEDMEMRTLRIVGLS